MRIACGKDGWGREVEGFFIRNKFLTIRRNGRRHRKEWWLNMYRRLLWILK